MDAAGFRAALLAFLCAACTSIAADARTFEATRWHVAAIDGRTTPMKGEYRMSFERGRVSARFGCNSIGGDYAVAGETITATGLISTMMACGEPADTFERTGSAVLNAPMRMKWISSGKLTLINPAGTIVLELSP